MVHLAWPTILHLHSPMCVIFNPISVSNGLTLLYDLAYNPTILYIQETMESERTK